MKDASYHFTLTFSRTLANSKSRFAPSTSTYSSIFNSMPCLFVFRLLRYHRFMGVHTNFVRSVDLDE
jgi:hypothetical protein